MKYLHIGLWTLVLPALAAAEDVKMDPAVSPSKYDTKNFRAEPDYSGRLYRPDEQVEIYGGKHQRNEPYYPMLFGRRMYGFGPFGEGINLFGSRNLAFPYLMAYGDWRTAYNHSSNGKNEVGELNTRMNLDIDLGITATERVHAFMRPFDRGGQFTGCKTIPGQGTTCTNQFNGNLVALFGEGDFGNILAGVTGKPNHIDLPFAAGEMPFILQNGIWVNDIFKGAAFTIPAMNSAALGISNMDATFFYAYQDVNTPVQAKEKFNDVSIYGTNLFIEGGEAYTEIGYGYTRDRSGNDESYHNVAVSFTKRYRNWFNWSLRSITNFGQHPGARDNKITANGELVLLETTWQTKHPYTLIPYSNFFGGFNKPQGLAQQFPILQNTGILFEPDGITSFPVLEGSANDTYGGAFGLEYLFNLDQQIVFETATVQVIGGPFRSGRNEKAAEYGFGARYELPLTHALIFRLDGIFDLRPQQANQYGGRTELRVKF